MQETVLFSLMLVLSFLAVGCLIVASLDRGDD